MYIELVKYPDVFLRSVSKTVPFPLDDKTSRLIRFMTKAMYQNHGIGLAAIQVGYQLRMFVMDCSRSGDNSKVFINPEIVEKSDETLRDSEGCLSAPGKTGAWQGGGRRVLLRRRLQRDRRVPGRLAAVLALPWLAG